MDEKTLIIGETFSEQTKPPQSAVPVLKPWKPAQPVKLQTSTLAQPTKIMTQKPKTFGLK